MLSRRKFIRNTAVAGAGVFLFKSGNAHTLAQTETSFPCFDLHAHPGVFMNKGVTNYHGDEAVTKTFQEMMAVHASGAFVALVADSPLLVVTPTGIKVLGAYKMGDGAIEYQRQINILKSFLKEVNIRPATKAVDFDAYAADKKPTIFISCEGGDFLEDRTDLLDQMHADGVRSLQVVHYAPSLLGDLQTQPSQHNGLSAAGKAVVKKLNKLHILVDIAHASFKTVQDVVAITDAPIMLSHSILTMDGDRPISARAISIEHAKAVASTGGIVGAWPSGFNKSFDEYGDNILRLIDAIGIDHVGLGTDMDGNFKPVLDSYKQMPSLAEILQKKGLSDNEVAKVMDGNAKRVIRKVLG
jgi:membrane dipeptidase